MKQLSKDFFKCSSIPHNLDTEAVMDFLSSDESVNKMIVMSELGLPALAGVVKELEDRFADSVGFPLNHNATNSNAPNRRNIGWMVRFIMKKYGYKPIEAGYTTNNKGRTRIGKFTDSMYFETAAVYQKDKNINPERIIVIKSI